MKILIVEDEIELASSIASYLQAEKYVCETATSFREAYDKIGLFYYDCILLDIMLPDGDGIKLLEELKKEKKQDGVIIISAKDSLEDKIAGLKIGADDYLAKPFHLSELGARIYSLIRRKQFDNSNQIKINEIIIDLPSKMLTIHDNPVELTKTEFDLLLFLIGNKNRVISKAAVAEHLSGDMANTMDNFDFVYSHIKNLKRKLTEAGSEDYIKTIYGTGYKFQL
ncbi:MAG: DNA-binding response regulator [Bacteroidetes bacterium 46-16]|nr:MAG: DNA-binding response regulator [Bacteroidetes bacterium 46-16]